MLASTRKERRRDRRALTHVLMSCLLAGAPSAQAEKMYQWVDPNTGTVQLAGKPPPWFRSATPGPRVRVYEHGKVIDDTAYAAPRAELAAGAETDTANTAAPDVPVPDQVTSAPEVKLSAGSSANQVKEFKALLEAWDRAQSVRADRARVPPASSTAVVPPPQ